MSHIVFVDVTHPKAYDFSTLEQQALGGTEASVLRTAEILSKQHQVSIYQKSRSQADEACGVSFLNQQQWDQIETADVIIVLRHFKTVQTLHQRFPQSRIFLWIHTYKNTEYALKKLLIAKNSFSIICNSQTHAEHTHQILNRSWLGRLLSLFRGTVPVHFCYNPIPQIAHQSAVRDQHKLLFLSSPNKGLSQVLLCFYWLYDQDSSLRLYIANPGYRSDAEISKHPGISVLGHLPHDQVIQHLATSLCLFYPQDVFAETFGLIYAEANAVGTPVIAHDIGSAREILHTNNTLLDAHDYPHILQTIQKWQKALPKVEYNTAFSSAPIRTQWENLFDA